MKKTDAAVQSFANGFLCSQALFSTYCEELGLDPEKALKIACGFGSGMSYTAGTCGAVTGAYMLIGLKHGKIAADDNNAKDETYALIQEFTRRFKEKYGSVQCKDLLGCDISNPEVLQEAKDKQLFTSVCHDIVRSAAEIVENLLELGDSDTTCS
ncbi:MAG: C-GCAxxG-C-C family protein [Bacillota bacterium]|nr:C-GCAxxG-C-C family protein [Bacillota bacterium]